MGDPPDLGIKLDPLFNPQHIATWRQATIPTQLGK